MAKNISTPNRLLLIGETGTGKTCLVDLFMNYTSPKKKFDIKKVKKYTPNEEDAKPMESVTTQTAIYVVDFGDICLEIIDTPGLLDNRGENQQENNIKNVITKVKELGYINGIALVINGTISRMNIVMASVFTEILKLLPPQILKNVIVIFTNSSNDYPLNFDLNLLKQYGLSTGNLKFFKIQNPFCKWLHEKKSEKASSQSTTDLSKKFVSTFDVVKEIAFTIATFQPVMTNRFGELHGSIDSVENAMIQIKLSVKNKRACTDTLNEMRAHLKNLKYFQEYKPEQPCEIMEKKDTSEKNVLCTKCDKNCHLNCHCFFCGEGWPYNLKHCIKFRDGICECGHKTVYHVKKPFKFETKIQNTASTQKDIDIQKKIEELNAKITGKNTELQQIEQEIQIPSKALSKSLKTFLRLGSNYHILEITKKEVSRLQLILNEICDFDKEEALDMLKSTVDIGLNPFDKDKRDENVILWACGMLAVDPDVYTEEQVTASFESLTKIHAQPPVFSFYEYAKKTLLKKDT